MDLGISGRRALLIGSSDGLGLACARSLAREGVAVTLNGRYANRLARAAEAIADEIDGAAVGYVAADLTTQQGLERIADSVSAVDILVTNRAGPAPRGDDWDSDALLQALSADMIPAVQLMRRFAPGMRERQFGRVVNIVATNKTPQYDLGLSASARAALAAFSHAISMEAAADNVTVNNLLPGRIDTRSEELVTEQLMTSLGVDRDEARRRIESTIPARRLGRPEEFGDACAYLCSEQASYISGQNLQLGGGSYRGLHE